MWNGITGTDLDNECLVCDTGKYNDGSSNTCMNVTAGWKAVAERTLDGGTIRKSLKQCREGTYSEGNSDECPTCPAGTYTAANGTAKKCSNATAGYETVDAAGQYKEEGAVSQGICAAGSYEVNSECKVCPAGTYATANRTVGSCTDANIRAGEYVVNKYETPKTAVPSKGEVPEANGQGVTTCGDDRYVNFAQTNNTSPNKRGCSDRDSTVDHDLRDSGGVDASDAWVRLEFHYNKNHVVVEQLDCGVNASGAVVMTRDDVNNFDTQRVATPAVAGELGICRCITAFDSTSVGYPHTTGCANTLGQCIHPLSCGSNLCDEASRTSANGLQSQCVTTYVKNKDDKCYGYHGDFVGKSVTETWRVDGSFCSGVTSKLTF